jgi:hypothetical protein
MAVALAMRFLESLLQGSGIKQLIADHLLTNKTNFNVRFNDFGESSLNILVYFHIETMDYSGRAGGARGNSVENHGPR